MYTFWPSIVVVIHTEEKKKGGRGGQRVKTVNKKREPAGRTKETPWGHTASLTVYSSSAGWGRERQARTGV
jgi:hypothetical protein